MKLGDLSYYFYIYNSCGFFENKVKVICFRSEFTHFIFWNWTSYWKLHSKMFERFLLSDFFWIKLILFLLCLWEYGIGNTQADFKTNQSALLSTECPDMFSSWPKWRGDEVIFWRVQERGQHYEITPKNTWLS